METYVGVFEAKTHLSELVEQAARGEEIVITKRGKRMARLVPCEAPAQRPDIAKVVKRMLKRRDTKGPRLPKGMTIKQLIEEGRRY